MKGHVGKYQTKTKGTLWRVVVQWTDAAGEPQRHDERGFATSRDAEKRKRELLTSIEAANYVERSSETVETYLTRTWLPAIEGTVRANTLRNYGVDVRVHIVPQIGDVKLQALSPADVQRTYAELLKGSAAKTVHNVGGTLGKALEDAVKWGLLQRNVARLVDRPSPAEVEMEAWTAEQLRAFLAFVADDRLSALWTLIATTGMRRGEAIGLRWSDVDLESGQLAIRQIVTEVNGKIVTGPPKTKSSVRTMRLDLSTLSALKSQRVRQAQERLECGAGWADGDLVFTREDGTPLRPTQATRRFTRLAEAAGLPRIGVHGLRHTYATVSLKAGVPLKVVSTRLGHSSTAITADRYSHVSPAWDQEAADITAAAIFGH